MTTERREGPKCKGCGNELVYQVSSSEGIYWCETEDCPDRTHFTVVFEPTAVIEIWNDRSISINVHKNVSDVQASELVQKLCTIFVGTKVMGEEEAAKIRREQAAEWKRQNEKAAALHGSSA